MSRVVGRERKSLAKTAKVKVQEVVVQKEEKHLIDPNTLDWSDDETDDKYWLIDAPSEPKAPPLEYTQVNQASVIEEHKKDDYYRNTYLNGGVTLHPTRGLLDREKLSDYDFKHTIPCPYIPNHVKEYMGEDSAKCLWKEFLDHGADVTEMVQYKHLANIATNMKHKWGFDLPFTMLKFDKELDSADDWIEYKTVINQLYKPFVPRPTDAGNPFLTTPASYFICCALPGCQLNRMRMHNDAFTDELEHLEGSHCLDVVYNTIKLQKKGILRVKHITEVLDEAKIPYEKKRLPSLFWELKGEDLIKTTDQFSDLLESIRTDMDRERMKDPDDLYTLPNWLMDEFQPSEIIMFKHSFKLIDIDKGGSIDIHELQDLTENLGCRVTIEQAQKLMDAYDIDKSGSIDFSEFMMLIYKIQHGTIDMENNLLAKVMLDAKSQLRVFEEIDDFQSSPPEHCHVHYYGGSPVKCDFILDGPPDTLYEGGRYHFRVVFPDGYPYKCPQCYFTHAMFHPNIYQQFDGSCNIPYLPNVWNSSWTLKKLCRLVIDLFHSVDLTQFPESMLTAAKAYAWSKEEDRRIDAVKKDMEEEVLKAKEEEKRLAAVEMQKKMMALLRGDAKGVVDDVSTALADVESPEAEAVELQAHAKDNQAAAEAAAVAAEVELDEHERMRNIYSNILEYEPLVERLNRVEQIQTNTLALYLAFPDRFRRTVLHYINNFNVFKVYDQRKSKAAIGNDGKQLDDDIQEESTSVVSLAVGFVSDDDDDDWMFQPDRSLESSDWLDEDSTATPSLSSISTNRFPFHKYPVPKKKLSHRKSSSNSRSSRQKDTSAVADSKDVDIDSYSIISNSSDKSSFSFRKPN